MEVASAGAGEPLPEPKYGEFKRWNSQLLQPETPTDEGGPRALVSPQAFAVDQWIYKDPQVSTM